ncbi:MAG TPA: DnaB-like helicase C-terminal domain-containing protein [Opitutaceae bacterium]|jgi:replicative DNA helicase|nr:DnaB-like helicase C-terminal domain-containing protein [Opitutaceae bacterium]
MSSEIIASCDQPPPSLEQSIIGAVLLDGKDVFARCQALGVLPEWFADVKCRKVFETFVAFGGGPIDPVIAWDELHRRGVTPQEITAADFCRMSDYRCATSLSLDAHVDQLRRWHLSRVRKGLFAAGAHEESPASELEAQERRVQELAATFVPEARGTPLAAAAAEYAGEVVNPRPRLLTSAVRTGLADFDRILTPFFPGQLIMLGARPGQGKSSLARQIALHVARQDEPVHCESLEMSAEEFAQYGSHQLAGVPLPLFGDRLPADLAERVRREASRIASLPITMTALPRLGPMLAAWEAQMGKARPPRLFILDYVQLVDPAQQKGETQDQAIGRISKALKRFAMRFRVPILAMSAVGRDSERHERVPTEADLRESGALEADADRVLILHRPAQTDKGEDQSYSDAARRTFEVHLYQRKARGAPTTKIGLIFDRFTTRFANFVEP